MRNRDLAFVMALVGLLVAVEAFYEHPTYGRGLQAAISVIRFGEML